MNKPLLNDEKTGRLYQLLTPFQATVKSFTQPASVKVNCIYRELRRFLFYYKKFADVLTMGTYEIYFSQHYDFPYSVSISMANTNSKQHVLLIS